MQYEANTKTGINCINIQLFGGFRAEKFTGEYVKIPNQKANALLGYLALNDHYSQTRERLAGLLWSDRSEEQARASLRQTIKRLRSVFSEHGIAPLQISRQDIRLVSEIVHIDLVEVETDLENGIVSAALLETRKPSETILYGYDNLDSLFTSWLTVTRQIWAEGVTKSLFGIMHSQSLNAADAARALVNIDDTNEEAHRFLIEYYADDRNTTAALKQYKHLWDILDEEYDMEPTEETQRLIASIKTGSHSPKQKLSKQNTSGMSFETNQTEPLPVISVEPFQMHDLDQQTVLRSTGLRYELIASLIKFRQWIIVEGTTESASKPPLYTKKPSSLQHFGYELNGACFIDDGEIRLILTLTNYELSRYIWSGIFSINLANWAKQQRHIVRQISVALNIHMSQQQLDMIMGNKSLPVETCEKWLRGQALSFVWRAEEREAASKIFLSIIRESPEFNPAYSGFVQLENTRHIAFPGIFRDQNRERNALEIAKAAIRKDPLDSRSQLCLAWSFVMNGYREQAINHFWLALDLNENDPWTMISAAGGLAVTGEIAEATRLAAQSLSLNPVPSSSHWAYQATVRFLAKDYDGCILACQQARDAVYYLIAWEAAAHFYLGNRSEAKARTEDFLSIVQTNWHGQIPPESQSIARWLVNCIPIFSRKDRVHLCNGIQHAGIPVRI